MPHVPAPNRRTSARAASGPCRPFSAALVLLLASTACASSALSTARAVRVAGDCASALRTVPRAAGESLYGALHWTDPLVLLDPHAGPGTAVILDGLYVGGLDVLQDIRLDRVDHVECLGRIDARFRFGSRYPGRVVVVRTGRPDSAASSTRFRSSPHR